MAKLEPRYQKKNKTIAGTVKTMCEILQALDFKELYPTVWVVKMCHMYLYTHFIQINPKPC